jgi:hypothetical protein
MNVFECFHYIHSKSYCMFSEYIKNICHEYFWVTYNINTIFDTKGQF